MTKYSFSWNDKYAVESPEIDAFVEDVTAVFRKHGVGINIGCGYDDSRSPIELVPFGEANFDWLVSDLDGYSGGIPWLDAVKARSTKLQEDAEAKRRKKQEEDRAELAAMKEAEERAQIAHAVEHGVVLGGKKYKLVEA